MSIEGRPQMEVCRITNDCQLWPELVAHLERSGDLRHVSDAQGIDPALWFVGAVIAGRVVGHISLKRIPLCVPTKPPTPLLMEGVELQEGYVQTFSVEVDYRRQGLGTALQQAASELSRELGCYQLRSWSSFDKGANYAVKLRLGFAFCPGIYTVPSSGKQIAGGWFVKQLQ